VKHGLKVSALEMRRFMGMLAHTHGGLFNASALGRSLGVSYHTIQNLLDLLEGYFLIRRLPPYHASLGKRLVKAPKLYVRDSGVLHHLLGIGTKEHLLESPARGNSFEGFVVEQLASQEAMRRPDSRFFFFRTQTGVEVDLIVDRGRSRIGYEIKCAVSATAKDVAHLKAAVADGVIQQGVLVYRGNRAFSVTENISVVPASDLLGGKEACFCDPAAQARRIWPMERGRS
jgi:predicted AAA+ superfamily ATPase